MYLMTGLLIVLLSILGSDGASVPPLSETIIQQNHRAQTNGGILPSWNNPDKFEYLQQIFRKTEIHYELKKISVWTMIYPLREVQDIVIFLIDDIAYSLKQIDEACGEELEYKFSKVYRNKLENALTLLVISLRDLGNQP